MLGVLEARNRVPKLSGTYRSHAVQHEPNQHNAGGQVERSLACKNCLHGHTPGASRNAVTSGNTGVEGGT